jgi:hypothetical protein
MSNSRTKHKSRHNELSPSESSDTEHVELQINQLEQKIKENKLKERKVDAKLENQIEKLENKVCHLSKKSNGEYKTVVRKLRRERHLMVNGSDAYGTFYSFAPQTIKVNEPVIFEKKSNVLNLRLKLDGNKIKVLRSGMYIVNFMGQFDQPCQMAFFVNDIPVLSTVVSSTMSNNMLCSHQVLSLYEDDILSLRNYLSQTDVTTSVSSGLVPNSTNLELSLYRIAPIPEKGCLPPHPHSSDSESSN